MGRRKNNAAFHRGPQQNVKIYLVTPRDSEGIESTEIEADLFTVDDKQILTFYRGSKEIASFRDWSFVTEKPKCLENISSDSVS
jgi:hypothetical protein